MSNASHRIEIEPIGHGERGTRYRVRHGGAVLVESTRNPELNAEARDGAAALEREVLGKWPIRQYAHQVSALLAPARTFLSAAAKASMGGKVG